jgi:hypothetical protein
MMLPKQAAGLCLWLLGVLVLLRRRTATTRIFFLWCMALALYTAGSAVATSLWDCYPAGLILLFRVGFSVGWFLSPALFGHFCRMYVAAGGERDAKAEHGARNRLAARLLPWAFYPLPLVALLTSTVPALSQFLVGSQGRLFWVILELGWLATLACGVVTLIRARGRTTDLLRRKQLEFVLAGSLAYILVFLHAFVTVLAGWDISPDTAWAWVPHVLLPLTPFAFAYAILRHRLLDLDVVIRRSLVYALLTLCMAAVFIVLQQLVGAALQAKTGATSLPAQTLAALAVAALFGPTERRLARLVEAVLNRRQTWRSEQLRRLGREIGFLDDSERLRRVMVRRLAEVMSAETVSLHWLDTDRRTYRLIEQHAPGGTQPAELSFDKNGTLAVWLAMDGEPLDLTALQRDEKYQRLDADERERLAAAGAALCVPLDVRGQLSGFLLLGAKQDRDLFSPEEKAALLAVAALAAAALQQAEMTQRLLELERDRAALAAQLQQPVEGNHPVGRCPACRRPGSHDAAGKRRRLTRHASPGAPHGWAQDRRHPAP